MNDVVVSVGVFVIFALAWGFIPGGDKLVWRWRPPQNPVTVVFVFGSCAFFFVKGILQLAH